MENLNFVNDQGRYKRNSKVACFFFFFNRNSANEEDDPREIEGDVEKFKFCFN